MSQIPDIQRLILKYAIYPEYICELGNKFKKANSYIMENPRAFSIIKTCEMSGRYWGPLLTNPEPKIIPYIIRYWGSYKTHVSVLGILKNPNPYIVNYLGLRLEGFDELFLGDNSNKITRFAWASCPSDYTTEITLRALDDNDPNFEQFRRGLARNPNPKAVNYILANWDELVSMYSEFIAENTNPLVIDRLSKWLETLSNRTNLVFKQLSANPSAIPILRKYPDNINIIKLLENPSLETYDLLMDVDYINEIMKNSTKLENLLCNPDPRMIELYFKWASVFELENQNISKCYKNPAWFVLDSLHTKRRVEKVWAILLI